ncbi:MAG: glycosyltransferase, partial [Bacteroidetes bacterium]|nr:glycosyltransferase [Bacteroidota bacterium]
MTIIRDGKSLDNEPLNFLVSVIIPVYKPRLTDLADCLKSVLHQTYQNIEIVCIDDASDDDNVTSFLLDLVRQGHRITHFTNDVNLGISRSTQHGIDAASGDFLLFVDQDDMLASGAVEALVRHSYDVDVVYADETLVSEEGFLGNVIFKPSFSPSLLEQCNYINHPFMVRVETLRKVGPLNPALDGAQDHDLLLRLLESGARFKHVAESLYFWRASPD